ncbi:MAG: protein kinase [Kofleriaceae bacterium]|nr:protein kinase [Kofleriaceae bacterium]
MKKPTPFGKYFLLERINVGGMAEVFRAKAFGVEGFERLVAVKRILPNIAEDKEFIRMFIEEAKLSVQLNHANIAQIFDLGVVDGSYYIALEHVHGRDLRGIFDRCRQGGEAMPVAQACFVVMKVCEGLDYAHNKRDQSGRELSLVHRDVSPQNVLVSFEGEVKLIDFGIAKAAGKGSKTQAGILKGKFGYMSPEQVRGLPSDRRSDVFSCGIVLYELLTGERLFVGESDFSTLEKVRNVEILPPSTYNRKIPDELERIVLKALAKDTEDRYQNAIDLHDELQAFVYTSGEFYSRKDLAGWMKKTFGKEIEDETAKLESYRQLKPPPTPDPAMAVPRTTTGQQRAAKPPAAPGSVRATQSGPAVSNPGLKPPPPPAGGRMGQQPITADGATSKHRKQDGLSWDDDELETQIYDNPEDDPKNRGKNVKPLPIAAPAPAVDLSVSPAATIRGVPPAVADLPSLATANSATASPTMQGPAPDLSSLVQTAKGWESGGNPALQPPAVSPAATINGLGHGLGHGVNGNGAPATTKASIPLAAQREPMFESGPSRSAPFDPMATFGTSLGLAQPPRKDNKMMILGIAGAAVAVGAVIAVIALTGGDKAPTTNTSANNQPAGPAVSEPASDQNTGFDLYVQPAGVTQWKLDGDARSDKLPLQIRNVTPGAHKIQIEAPPGFLSQSREVTVERGKAPKIEIVLSPIAGIHGVFDSTPPGATVSLIIEGKPQPLGPSPVKAPLDPRLSYQVLFEKPGYVSVNRPIVFTGALEEKIVVPLEKAGGGTPDATTDTKPVDTKVDAKPTNVATSKPDKTTKTGPVTKIEKPSNTDTKPNNTDTKPVTNEKPDIAKAGNGVLKLGAKPRCEIYIDGAATGLFTPQLDLKLAAGKHRITLVNNEFGIRESFSVEIKADATEKVTKDYSDKLPK